MKLSDPYSREELKAFAQVLKIKIANSLENIEDSIFFEKPAIGWSPAENIQHLNKVTRLLTLSFSTPKLLATIVFGKSSVPARKFQEIGDIYLDALNKVQNSGPFTPSSENPNTNKPKRKNELILDWNKNLDKYSLALNNWNEEQLNSILMPHPFLGKIPAREMYMIGMLHPIHHCNIFSKRLNEVWSYF